MTKRKTRKQITKEKYKYKNKNEDSLYIYKPPKPSTEPRDKKDCGCGQPDTCHLLKEQPGPKNANIPTSKQKANSMLATRFMFNPVEITDKNKQGFLELTGPVRYYADLFRTTEGIDHEVYKAEEIEPRVGDFVKFKNFVDRKNYNGKIGLIQKELDESRFTIATMNDARYFSVSIENFDVIKNCNGVFNRMETGEMIWPKIKGWNVPSSHWVKDRTLTAMTMNLFEAIHFYEWDDYNVRFGYADTMPEKNPYKFKYGNGKGGELVANGPGKQKFLAPFTNLAYNFFRDSCYYDQWMPEVFQEFYIDYTERVKQLFGWTSPVMLRFATGSDQKANLFIVCFDKDSIAEINDWYEHTVVNDNLSREESDFDLFRNYNDCCGFKRNNLPEIRGPFIMIKPTMQLRKMMKRENMDKIAVCTVGWKIFVGK